MEKTIFDYISLGLGPVAPRSNLIWRQWASQADSSLKNRQEIISSFTDYVKDYPNLELIDNIANSVIKNVSREVDSFFEAIK
jgi:hypothetical protein